MRLEFDPDRPRGRPFDHGRFVIVAALAGLWGGGCARLERPAAPSRALDSTAAAAVGAHVPAKVPVNTDGNDLALEGYDPVSYFDSSKPVKGSAQITASDGGATYRFTSEEHRRLFVADPKRYEPAYGGFCAAGVAHGYKVGCDPGNYKIEDGKLYLFNKTLFLDASKGWNAQEKKAADQNWERATAP